MHRDDDQKENEGVQDEVRARNEPVQSDRVVEEPALFPPAMDGDISIGGSPEEQGVLREEQSR